VKKFLPYTIHHVYLDKSNTLPEISLADKGAYLVFWWQEIALGDLYLQPGRNISKSELYQQLISAIKPAINFYTGLKGIEHTEWYDWITNRDFESWHSWMDLLLAAYENDNIPASVPVSVVICTRNRAAHLKQCLTALKKLRCTPQEIVVVDNAPEDDETEKVVQGFADVKYVKEPRPGLDFARNTGILNSTQEVVAFTDDDVRVQPNWVYHVFETFRDKKVGAMTGLIIALAIDTEAQFIFEKYWSFNRGYMDKTYDDHFFNSTLPTGPPVWEIGAGANMAFRRSAFEVTGFFDELLDVGAAGCNGDSEMWFRILHKGFNIKYNPRAITSHEHRKDITGLKKQIFYYMRGFTVAALIQQALVPEAGYKKYKLRKFPLYYRQLILKDFPKFSLRLKTLHAEVSGIMSGLKFYRENKKPLT